MAKFIYEMDMSTEKVLTQDEGFSKARISTSASAAAVVKSSAGFLKAISFNKRSPGTLTVYDTATNTGSHSAASILGVFDSSTVVRVAELNVSMTKGIVVVAAVTGGDYTIIYR